MLRKEEQRGTAVPMGALARGGSHAGLSATAPPSAAVPELPGEAQLGASYCARHPGELASLHSFFLSPQILRLSSSIS